MRLSLFALSVCLASLAVTARADQFTITGTNTITFSLPASPIPASSTSLEGFIVNNVDVTFNGSHKNESVLFFEDGIIIADSTSIVPDGIFFDFNGTNEIADDFTIKPDPSSFLGYSSTLAYSGGESSPTFLPGSYELQDNLNNGDTTLTIAASTSVAATPEPSSLALLGTGLAGLTSLVRRRRA